MTYQLYELIEDEEPKLKKASMLYLDGMLVAGRALEDVYFTVELSADRSDLSLGIKNPEDLPPHMDRRDLCTKAREMALGSDILDLPDGRVGIIWNDELPPNEQMCPFDAMPQVI